MMIASSPPIPDEWDRCHAYNHKKRRFCRQEKCSLQMHQSMIEAISNNTLVNIKEAKYCGHHINLLLDTAVVIEEQQSSLKRKNIETCIECSPSSIAFDRQSKRGIRVPCPCDPSHYIYESNLKRHVLKCPKAKQKVLEESSIYYKCNINRGGYGEINSKIKNQELFQNTTEFVDLITKSYQKIFMNPKTSTPNITLAENHDLIEMKDIHEKQVSLGFLKSIEDHKIKTNGKKNIHQIGSFVGNLQEFLSENQFHDENDKNNNNLIVLELGAGRGILGLIASGRLQALHQNLRISLHLIDRSGSRNKMDGTVSKQNKFKEKENEYLQFNNVSTNRIKCDLAHVQLSNILSQENKNSSNKILVLSKHLCGAGTDIALKSLSHLKEVDSNICYAYAPCCYGICSWEDYVGRPFLQQLFKEFYPDLVMNAYYFDILKRWSCLAAAVENDKAHSANILQDSNKDDSPSWHIQNVLKESLGSYGERGLGRMCQRLIDYGRIEYMKHVLGMTIVDISYYVSEDITPQNCLILGMKEVKKE